MQVNIPKTCALLAATDNVVILSHTKPDGDTLGTAFALLFALEKLGKIARVECCDGFPARYAFLFGDYVPKPFSPEFVVTVDVAGLQLLGELEEVYGDKIDLCIDHHMSNDLPAKYSLIDAASPATAQIMCKVIQGMGIAIDKNIADAIFTGLSTDTGCFKYTNVTPETHRCAAEMIEAGADHGTINKLMFDTMTKGRLEVDRLVMDTIAYYFDGQCAIIIIPQGLLQQYGVTEDEMDGISAKPRRITGVKAGVTIREREDGVYRISLRTGEGVNASRICQQLGGGGHMNAAGCTLTGTLESAKKEILDEISKELERLK